MRARHDALSDRSAPSGARGCGAATPNCRRRPGRAPPRRRWRRRRRAPRSGRSTEASSPTIAASAGPGGAADGRGCAGSSAACRSWRTACAAAARASSTSSCTATGSPATIRGAGRPASAAAARDARRDVALDRRALAIHRIVPAAVLRRRPGAGGARARRPGRGTGCGERAGGGDVDAERRSPLRLTGSPRSSGARIWTYSSVCAAGACRTTGRSMPSMTGWCDGPTPIVSAGAAHRGGGRGAPRLAWSTGWHV